MSAKEEAKHASDSAEYATLRPGTLAEVAQLAASGDSFDRGLANFLDGFYAAPDVVE